MNWKMVWPLYVSMKTTKNVESLQRDLEILNRRCLENKMIVEYNNSRSSTINSRKKKNTFNLKGFDVENDVLLVFQDMNCSKMENCCC